MPRPLDAGSRGHERMRNYDTLPQEICRGNVAV